MLLDRYFEMTKKNFFYRDELGEEIGRIFLHFLNYFDTDKIFECKIFENISIKEQLKLMVQTFSSTIYVNFEHIIHFSDELADVIEEQYYRVEPYICESIYEFINENNFQKFLSKKTFPKRFWIGFYNLPLIRSIEKMSSEWLHKLVSIHGVVTRVSEPYLELLNATFKCENNSCGYRINFFEQNLQYSEPKICPNCYSLNNWSLLMDDSIFIYLQKIRIQEVKTKGFLVIIPKTLDILLREDNVGIAKLGDRCLFTGTFLTLTTQKKSFRPKEECFEADSFSCQMKDISETSGGKIYYKTFFLATHCFSSDFRFYRDFSSLNNSFEEFSCQYFFSRSEKEKIMQIRSKKKLLKFFTSKLGIYSKKFENLKIGIILSLVGGVIKTTIEKLSKRGNINICLIGNSLSDKNKILKDSSEIFPRNILVNGNNLFDSGIAASLIKDHEKTGFWIEAGPLLLAHKGICCIDNFDKLTFKTQVSVCEVMEHQNVFLIKGDTKVTLKSKTSILASLNVLNEKYDKTKTLKKNLGLDFPFFSKFDLFFLLIEKPDFFKDAKISQKIYFLNRENKKKPSPNTKGSYDHLYISFARCLNPVLTDKSGLLIIRIYKYLRKCQFLDDSEYNFLTVRQLESLIRLSESFSKIYLGLYVKKFHVKAAAKLLFYSLYPLNFSIKKIFSEDFGHDLKFRKKKKEKSTVSSKKKAKIKISFQEFQILSKNIKKEMEIFKNIKFNGISFRNLIKRIVLSHYFTFSSKTKCYQIQKIMMIIKYMIFSHRSLIVIKSFSDFKKKKIKRLIHSKYSIPHRTGFEPVQNFP